MERFTDLLSAVRNTSDSFSFNSCEPELIELMRQIDGMIEEKRKEWEIHIDTLEHENRKITKENINLQNELRNTNHELSMIKLKSKGIENEKHLSKAQYSDQVTQLKTELQSLKRNYYKLLKRSSEQRKQYDQNQVDRGSSTDCHLKPAGEKQNLVDAHDQLLKKCDKMQEQLLAYQSELNKKTRRLETVEEKRNQQLNDLERQINLYKTELTQKSEDITKIEGIREKQLNLLENKMEEYRKKMSHKDGEIARLKNELEEQHSKVMPHLSPVRRRATDDDYINVDEDKSKQLEDAVRKLTNRLDLKICELQVCNAQIEAIRLENDHLRSLVKQGEDYNNVVTNVHTEETLGAQSQQDDYLSDSSLHQSVLSIDNNRKSRTFSHLQSFIDDESTREKDLEGRILSYIYDFDQNVNFLKKHVR